MQLTDVWPLFGLRLLSPRLELRPVRDADLPALADAAEAGIHDPLVMPFASPWTDAAPADMRAGLAQHVWSLRATIEPNDWNLLFAVLENGVPIGVQDLRASEFATLRTVSSGSWLTMDRQGEGFGTEMRAALLMFAFDELGATVAKSGAAFWNVSSLAVSRRLGYRDNGVARFTSRVGQANEEQLFRLTPAEFVRPDWALGVEGADAARRALVG